jgi:hypothetical protein
MAVMAMHVSQYTHPPAGTSTLSMRRRRHGRRHVKYIMYLVGTLACFSKVPTSRRLELPLMDGDGIMFASQLPNIPESSRTFMNMTCPYDRQLTDFHLNSTLIHLRVPFLTHT